jgi:hypothetical protein
MRRPSLPRPGRPVGPPPPSLWPAWARALGAVAAIVLIAGLGFGAGYLVFNDDEQGVTAVAPTPVVVEGAAQPDAADQIGFPSFATRNTTRVGGADPTADAAGVALASYPTEGGVAGPEAVVLAPAGSWQEALAATPLAAEPLSAPILLGDPGEVPGITQSALEALSPRGLPKSGEDVIAVGDVAHPDGAKVLEVKGSSPEAVADGVDQELADLTGEKHPDHLLVVSSSDAAYAMPAGFWAARSGDPILFADGDDVPDETLAVIKRHPDVPVYVLGPESVISNDAFKTLAKEGASVTRVGKEDPVENAIDFARFADGSFGWDINDPGHGFAIANIDRPEDAAAGAPLAAGGKPGPLLLTDDPEIMPPALTSFLVDTQPGYLDDPTRAVYNHVWILGGEDAISVGFQSQVDDLTKLAPVSGSTSVPDFGTGGGSGGGGQSQLPNDSAPGGQADGGKGSK